MTRADALVLFGATGDLARKKLFGALYRLEAQHRLDLPVIGVAPSDWDDERFRTPWAAMMAMLLAISASVLDGSGLGLSVQLRNTALRSEKSRSLLTMTRSVSSGLAGRPRQPGRVWTVVESAVEDIVDGADGNRRLGRHGDALVGDVTAVSLA